MLNGIGINKLTSYPYIGIAYFDKTLHGDIENQGWL